MSKKKQWSIQSAKATLFGNNRFWKIDGTNTAAYLLPIRLTLLYVTISILIYAFGPFEWTTYRPVLFYSLLVIYMLSLWLGYRVGLMRDFRHSIEWKETYTDKAMGVLSVLVVVNYILYVINIFRDYGFSTLDFPELFKQMSVGLMNPGLGYNLRLERLKVLQGNAVIGGTALSLFNYLWSFVRYPILIFSMLYFKRLKGFGKAFTALYLVTMVLFYLSIGTNIDVLHVFLLIEIAPITNAFSSWYKKEMTPKRLVKLIASLLAGVIFVCCYFTWMMVSRGGINNYDQPDYNISGVQLESNIIETEEDPVTEPPMTTVPNMEATEPVQTQHVETAAPSTDATISTEPTLVTEPAEQPDTGFTVPPIIMKFWISFSAYFTQGYYGMSQGLNLPWTPMFGVGNSMFLVDFLSEHVYDIDQFTYQMKIENAYGWESDMRWHGMFTWLANDVSFYGIPIVMFALGILFAMMFKDAVTSNNPFARASVFYYILMMLFIPCNNQIAQRADTLLSFILLVFCWLLCKHPPAFLRKWLSK